MIRVLKVLTLVVALSPLAALAENVDVKIEGMTCGSCEAKVKKELEALKGIDTKTLKVSVAGNHATMTIAKDDAKMRKAIEDAVKKAGYTVTKIELVNPAAPKAETKKN